MAARKKEMCDRNGDTEVKNFGETVRDRQKGNIEEIDRQIDKQRERERKREEKRRERERDADDTLEKKTKNKIRKWLFVCVILYALLCVCVHVWVCMCV